MYIGDPLVELRRSPIAAGMKLHGDVTFAAHIFEIVEDAV
jgi:hypothetical protein